MLHQAWTKRREYKKELLNDAMLESLKEAAEAPRETSNMRQNQALRTVNLDPQKIYTTGQLAQSVAIARENAKAAVAKAPPEAKAKCEQELRRVELAARHLLPRGFMAHVEPQPGQMHKFQVPGALDGSQPHTRYGDGAGTSDDRGDSDSRMIGGDSDSRMLPPDHPLAKNFGMMDAFLNQDHQHTAHEAPQHGGLQRTTKHRAGKQEPEQEFLGIERTKNVDLPPPPAVDKLTQLQRTYADIRAALPHPLLTSVR